MKILATAYYAEPESSIKSYFYQVGIIGNEKSPSQIIEDLTHSCIYPTFRFLNLHRKQLNAYILWKWKGRKSVEEVIGDKLKFKFSQK